MSAYIDDAAEGADGIRTVDGVGATASILHDGAGNHNDILGRVGQLLDDKVDHLS